MKTTETRIFWNRPDAMDELADKGEIVTEFSVVEGWLKYGTAREWVMVPMSEVRKITYSEVMEDTSNVIDRSQYHKFGQTPPSTGDVSEED